jgi:hypothetical protein
MRCSAAFLLLLALGCAKNPTPEGPVASCASGQFVIVTNDWNEPVEVFATMPSSSTPTSLGIVQAGSREELPLPEGSPGAFVRTTRTIEPSAEPRLMRQLVFIRYRCR